jgi:hypothetical protein
MLQEMQDRYGFGSFAETIREAMRVVHALQSQAQLGFSDVIVQNPDTLDQRRLVIPSLARLNRNLQGAVPDDQAAVDEN